MYVALPLLPSSSSLPRCQLLLEDVDRAIARFEGDGVTGIMDLEEHLAILRALHNQLVKVWVCVCVHLVSPISHTIMLGLLVVAYDWFRMVPVWIPLIKSWRS